jgi:hypothetical protein
MWMVNYKKRRSAWLMCLGLCAAIFVACFGTARAQGSTLPEDWAHTWGGSGNDELSGVAADGNGNVYVAGRTGSFGAGGWDVLLLKYSPSGTLLCRQTWGGLNNDNGRDVTFDPSGRFVYVAGWTESSPTGNTDVLLVKFDTNCNFIWAQSWDFGGNEDALRVKVDPSDGNLVIGGRTRVGTNLDDALLMKVAEAGSTPPQVPAWATTWDVSWESTNDIAFGGGGIYSCGQTIPPGGYGIDPYLARYDSNGNLEWLTTWNRTISDSGYSCTSDESGNIYVAVYSVESSQPGSLLKFGSSGVLEWARTWDSGGSQERYRVVVGSDSSIYVVGSTNGFDGVQWDPFLLKYDAAGTLLDSAIRRGTSAWIAWSATAMPGAIVLAGAAANNTGSWLEFPGTPGSGPVTTTLQLVNSVPVSLTPTNVVGTSSVPAGVEDTGGGGFDAFVAKLTLPFLTFPLPNKTAMTAAIKSVFDHSMTGTYCGDEVITAYTGEEGFRLFGSDLVTKFTCSTTGKTNFLYGFRNGSGQSFVVNGHYAGGGKTNFLYYQGHPGYDYITKDQNQDGTLCASYPNSCNSTGKTPVLAAADGTVVCAAGVALTGKQCSGASSKKYNEVKIEHTNGYSTVYLHLSRINVKLGDQVVAGQQIGISGDAGVTGNPHLHFELRRNDGNVPVDPYGWAPNPALPNYGQATDPYRGGEPPVVNANRWK